MNKTMTAADHVDVLAARARRLLAAGAYLPGRAHFAAIIGERIYHAIVDGSAKGAANGRATLAELAARLFRAAGDDVRAEGCRMLCAAIMGVWFNGGTCDVFETPTPDYRAAA